jgi:hypothetical protein
MMCSQNAFRIKPSAKPTAPVTKAATKAPIRRTSKYIVGSEITIP